MMKEYARPDNATPGGSWTAHPPTSWRELPIPIRVSAGAIAFLSSVTTEDPEAYLEHAEYLARVPLFTECPRDQLSRIAKLMQPAHYAAGQLIVTQGAPGQAFYIILTGKVEIERDGQRLGSLDVGDFFGEMSLLDDSPRSATIRAVEPTDCLMLSSWDFKTMLDSSPEIAGQLLQALSRRLRFADELSVR